MDLNVEQTRVPGFLPAVDETRRESFRADCVVPDAMPDVQDVLLSNGEFCLWRLDVHNGSAELEGEYTARICCAAESTGEPLSVSVSVPVLMRFQNPRIVRGLRPVLLVDAPERNVQVLNSRKLRVQCLMSASLTGYLPEDLALTVGLSGGEGDLHVKKEPVRLPVIPDVTEQVFHVTETIPLRAGMPADGRVLCHGSSVLPEETSVTDDGVIVRGKVVTELCYRDAAQSELVSETLETPFSQRIDPEAGEGTLLDAETQLHLTSVELQCRTDDPAVDVTYHLVLQTVCRAEVRAEIVTDAYCIGAALTPVYEDLADSGFRQIVSAATEPTEPAAPGVVLVRRTESPELWALAKAYGSSEAAIRAANPETETPPRWMIVPRLV